MRDFGTILHLMGIVTYANVRALTRLAADKLRGIEGRDPWTGEWSDQGRSAMEQNTAKACQDSGGASDARLRR